MNKKSRQNVKNNIEKDFYKIMNNANFGFDCRNNANNTKFEPVIDEISEISYIKKYYSLFDKRVKKFVRSDILQQQIHLEYEQAVAQIRDNDPFKNVRLKEVENEEQTNMDALKCFVEKEKKSKKRKIKEVNAQFEDALKNKKNKTMIDFDKIECNSIKSILIKGSDTVDVSSRFIKGKMLMFGKLSLTSFVYDLIDVFCFPDAEIKQIYDSYETIKCFIYLNLTYTDSTSIFSTLSAR